MNGLSQPLAPVLGPQVVAESVAPATHIAPAAPEAATTGGAVQLILLGIAGFFVCTVVAFNTTTAFPILLGAVALFAGILKGGRKLVAARTEKFRGLADAIVGPHMEPGERVVATCEAMRSGFATWMIGVGKRAQLVFTDRRLYVVMSRGLAHPMAMFMQDPGKVLIKACNYREPGAIASGGLMFPPALHVCGKRLRLRPMGEDKALSWCAYVYGSNNGRTASRLLAELGA